MSISLREDAKDVLSTVGVAIASDSLCPETQSFLITAGMLSAIGDVQHILNGIDHSSVQGLNQSEVAVLRTHLLGAARYHQSDAITQQQREKLRSLPLFITLGRGEDHTTVQCHGSMGNNTIFVKADPHNIVIPDTNQNLSFIDMNDAMNQTLVMLVDPNCNNEAKSDIAFLEWSISLLEGQHDLNVKTALAHCALRRFSDLSNHAKEQLHSCRFITAGDGSIRAPNEIINIDETCPLVSLFDSSEDAWPIGEFSNHRPIYNLLRTHGLLLADLTPQIIVDRLMHLHNSTRVDRARALLKLLELASEDVLRSTDVVARLRDQVWIPIANDRLVGAGMARHKRNQSAFDKVLEAIDVQNEHLIEALGWNAALPFDVVREQIRLILLSWNSDPPRPRERRMKDLLRYIACRLAEGSFTASHIQILRTDVGDSPWIPIDGQLYPTRLSVRCRGRIGAPFVDIPRNWCDGNVWRFLHEMGCTDRLVFPLVPARSLVLTVS
jgi:hypothetical protein